jgi:hypothetical protein
MGSSLLAVTLVTAVLRKTKELAGLKRVGRVEGIVERVYKRFNHIEIELRKFREGVFEEIARLKRELNTRFYWLMGIQISNVDNTI